MSHVLKSQVVLRSQSYTSTENVINASSLLEESVHTWGILRNQRSLAEVGENRKNWVEVSELSFPLLLHLDAGGKFSKDAKVVDDWRSQKGIFTSVVHSNGVVASLRKLEHKLASQTIKISEMYSSKALLLSPT